MDPAVSSMLAQLGPVVIGTYLLMDRIFKYVGQRNGSNPDENVKILVHLNKDLIDQNKEVLSEIRHMRLELAASRCPYGRISPEKE